MQFLEDILSLSKVLGVSLIIEENQISSLTYCLLSRNKEGIHIIEYKEIDDLKQLPISDNIPIVLNISGEGILNKKISLQGINEQKALETILPGSPTEEFLVQLYNNSNASFCSLVRVDALNEILDSLGDLKDAIISISLSHFSIMNSKEVLDERDTIELSNLKFVFEEKLLKNIESEKKESNFVIDGNVLKDEEFSAFSVAYQYFLDKESSIEISDFLSTQREDFKHKVVYSKLKYAIPFFFILLLLVNFLLFSNATNTNNSLSSSLYQNQSLINQLDSLKKEVILKENFLKEEQWFSNSRTSFYADRIASTFPEGINLNELDIFPIYFENNSKDYSYQKNRLEISGTSTKALVLNNWTKVLKEQIWVKDFEIVDFNQSINNGNVDFKLIINLKETNV